MWKTTRLRVRTQTGITLATALSPIHHVPVKIRPLDVRQDAKKEQERIIAQLKAFVEKAQQELASQSPAFRDFTLGAFRGLDSSISFGAVGSPQEGDSTASRLGQLLGTGTELYVSVQTFRGGATLSGLGVAAEGPSLGTSTGVVVAGSGAMVVGGLGILSGTKNLAALATGALQKSDSTTPTGKTSSGQDINKHGEKLGPSQSPMRHNKGFSTTKGAKDAARRAGKSGPIRDRGHFHATDRSGRKLPNAGHFSFPD